MGILDDILQGAQDAGSAVFGPPGSGSVMDIATQNSPIRRLDRLREIREFARQKGYFQGDDAGREMVSPWRDSAFARDYPDLAEEADGIETGMATGLVASSGIAPAGGGALVAARGIRPSSPGAPPPQGGAPHPSPGASTPPPQAGVPHPQGPAGGWVPNQAANPPGAASPQGPIGPMPGRVNGGIPMPGAAPAAPAAAQAGTGLLGTIGNAVRQHPIIATALAGGGLLATGAAVQGRSSAPPPADPNAFGPGMPITENAWQQADKAEEKRQAEARRATQARRDNADIGLTEAQVAYYQAQMEKARREIANMDISDADKLDLQHAYEMELRAEIERAATERTMITEAGENERTERREQGEDRRTTSRGGVEMRGQDQQARQAQDNFVTNWLQNQIANGQLSLDRATKMFEAYQKQQTLPAEILDKVSQATARMEQYRTTVNDGQAPPGFEAGGVMAGLSKMAGIKFDPKQYIPQKSQDSWIDLARQYGAVPSGQPMPTVDQVFTPDVGRGADMSAAGVEAARGMSASNAELPRPEMPDDVQQRIMAGLR